LEVRRREEAAADSGTDSGQSDVGSGAVRAVAKRGILGFSAVTDGDAAIRFDGAFLGFFAGILGFMGTVTVGFVSRLSACTIIFDSRSFIDIIWEIFVRHVISCKR